MSYTIQGGKRGGGTFVNPFITLSGLGIYIDPSNKRSVNADSNSIYNLLDKNNTYTTILSSLSTERNNTFSYFNFNDLRNLIGTYSSSLSTCCVQCWVRRSIGPIEETNNFLGIGGRNDDIPIVDGHLNVESWVHNLTLSTELTTIDYSNFYSNSLFMETGDSTGEKINNSTRIVAITSLGGGTTTNSALYFIRNISLQDLRENNISWELSFESSFGRAGGSQQFSGNFVIFFNSNYGVFNRVSNSVYGGIPNSFAVSYDMSTNSVSLLALGDEDNPIATATVPFALASRDGGTVKRIFNWVNYDKVAKRLTITVNEINFKNVPIITVQNFDPYVYLKPPQPPYISDIFVSKFASNSAYGIHYNRLGFLGFSIGDDSLDTDLEAISGEWDLITFNFEEDRVRLFKNLTYFETEKPENIFKTNSITIGNTNNVDIGQIMFYDRSLTDKEIIDNYKNFVSRYNVPQEKLEPKISLFGLDPDTLNYINRAGITNFRIINRINSFIIGLKKLNLFGSVNCWPLIQGQNTASGNTLFSFGSAYDNVPAQIIGTGIRTVSGITLDPNSYIDTFSPGPAGASPRTVMMIINNNQSSGFLGGWGQINQSWSVRKPTLSTFRQEYNTSPAFGSINAGRGVGASFTGAGSLGVTWSNVDYILQFNLINPNGTSGNFYINRGSEYNLEKNNETYAFVLKSNISFSETEFYEVYELFKNTIGKDLKLPEALIPIVYDPDTISYLSRLSEVKPYFYRKAINDFIIYLKSVNLWDDVVVFPLGTNVNNSAGRFQSFGNYTPGINYEADIMGFNIARQPEGLFLSSTSYLSTNVPGTTGSDSRTFVVISNGNFVGFPRFMLGEGTNVTNLNFNIKRVSPSNAIIDCWFNSSNSFPCSKGVGVTYDINGSFQTVTFPGIVSYAGNMRDIDTFRGNLLLNAPSPSYQNENNTDTYYFLLKSKRSYTMGNAFNSLIAGLYNSYKNTIGRFNNDLGPGSRPVPMNDFLRNYCQLSGNFVDYTNYVRINNFINELSIANSTSTSPLFNLNLFNNMVCWPLRQGQNAGAQFTSRFTGSTVYSLGGLPQASAVRIGPIQENSSGTVSSSLNSAASGRIITTTRRLTGYSQRTFYAAANISNFLNFTNPSRRARLMYTTLAEPGFVEFGGSQMNGIILEGFGHGSQMCNTQSLTTTGNIATVNISSPSFNTFNTFGTIYSGSRIFQYRNRVILGSAGEEQYSSRPNTPGWASTLTDAKNLTLMNSEDEPLPFGGSMIGTLAFAADFNLGLTNAQLSTFDLIYRSTLGEGIAFQ